MNIKKQGDRQITGADKRINRFLKIDNQIEKQAEGH